MWDFLRTVKLRSKIQRVYLPSWRICIEGSLIQVVWVLKYLLIQKSYSLIKIGSPNTYGYYLFIRLLTEVISTLA